MAMKNEGKFTILRDRGGDYEVNCNDFYVEKGFLIIEHKDEDIEYLPIDQIACVVKYKNKQESVKVWGNKTPTPSQAAPPSPGQVEK